MPEKPTPQFLKEQKKRCPQCGGTLPCSTHGAEITESEQEKVEMKLFQSETLYKAQENEWIGTISVAPDGTNWSAIIVRNDGMYATCVNRVVEEWHDEVGSVRFLPNGHYVYFAEDSYLDMETHSVYKDGKRIDVQGDALWPTCILDDGRIVARTEKEDDGHTKYYLYVEDEIIAQSDYEIQEPVTSGNHYACVSKKESPNGKMTHELIYDGTPKTQADAIDQVVLKDNGKTLAYVAYNHSKTAENTEQQEATIYVNDETYEQVTLGPHDQIKYLLVSTSGKRVAYKVARRDVSGNETFPTYIDHEKAPHDVRNMVFSPNEENILVIASDDTSDERREILLLNGQEIIKEKTKKFYGFLDNETWYASCEQSSDQWMIINNVEGEHFTSVHEPQQSPDKKHIAYIAGNYKDGVILYYVVINHETKPLPFDVASEIVFSDDGKSLYVFGKENGAAVKKTFSLNTTEPNQERALPAQKQY